jgi:hypothetical protein
MASITRDELTDVIEDATPRQTVELTTKSAEARRTQTKRQQQARQPKQDFPIDVSRERSAKPAGRKRTTKAAKTTHQASQTPAPTDKSTEEMIPPVPHATNNTAAPAIGTASAHFVADTEPVAQDGGFLCTFTLSRPGLVGLNKLAIYLNDLQDSGSIGGWQAKGWEDAATKVRPLIGFANRTDAIVAIKNSAFSQ